MDLTPDRPSGRPRRRRLGFLLGVVTILGTVASAELPSGATLGDGTFEIEGNLVVNGGLDWASAAAAPSPSLVCDDPATPSVNEASNCGVDKPTGQSDDSFGNGTKEDTAVPSVTDGSIPNNKSDLTRFYVASNKETVNGQVKDMLYLAWERVQDPSGTTNMDFEFNQSTAGSGNGVTAARTGGDVLIKFDLSQGGSNPSFGLHRWQSGQAPWNQPCEASAKFPCWGRIQDINGAGQSRGAVNNSGTVSDPVNPGAPRTLSIRTFGEAAINLTDTNVLGTGCTSFGSAYLKSRSSDSFTAAVKDFIAPIPVTVTNCQPATINLVKYDSKGTAGDTTDDVLLAGATLQLWRESNSTAGVQTTGATPDTLLLTCTSNQSACSGFTTTTSGTYYGVESAAPNGYETAPNVTQAITIGQSSQTFNLVFRDSPAPGDINVHKQDDAGNPLPGVTFSLYKDVSPFSADSSTTPGAEDTVVANRVGTCTTDGGGDCTFQDVALGTYWVVETTGPGSDYGTAAPQHVTMALGGTPGTGQEKNLTFTNARKHRVIVIVCHEGTDTLASSAVTVNNGSPASSLAAAPSGMTESQLCGLGGATFGGLDHGAQSVGVTLGTH